ncbi:MAG: hypothetical protein MJA27_25590 [Pseudanabaenales cyanobacterium]|nr:hypothetical protein [Pseudanabaenales cyanobacterium]
MEYRLFVGFRVRSLITVSWFNTRKPSVFEAQNCDFFACLCDRRLTIPSGVMQ